MYTMDHNNAISGETTSTNTSIHYRKTDCFNVSVHNFQSKKIWVNRVMLYISVLLLWVEFWSSFCHFPFGAFIKHFSLLLTDFSLHVSLYYRETLVKEVTVTTPEGCRITSTSPSSPSSSSSSSPCSEDRFHSGAEIVLFPAPYPESQRQGAELLPNILEKGVLLWMTADGLYAKRLCQGRVYWEGPLAPYVDKPNKLEKEQPCKLFDTHQFLVGKQKHAAVCSFASTRRWHISEVLRRIIAILFTDSRPFQMLLIC